MLELAARIRWLAAVAAVFAVAAVRPAAATPTIEEYVAASEGKAVVVEPGQLTIDGRRARCGNRPVVLDATLDDYAAAYPGYLILNPQKLAGLPTGVKLWIFSHECAHQFRGPDEETADCFAAQRGRRQGWLNEQGVEEVCHFISPAAGDAMHFAGPQRCNIVRKCFQDKTVH